MIYCQVVRSRADGPFKLTRTRNVHRHTADRAIEAELSSLLSNYRLAGEWFQAEALLPLIEFAQSSKRLVLFGIA